MFYRTEEKAMAPGISGDWPKVIQKPDNPHGRLVLVDGLEEFLEEILHNGCTMESVKEKISKFLGT